MQFAKKVCNVTVALGAMLCVFLLCSCAGERQGVVCDEIEYRLNTMAYSPDQRAFQEDELRACREEESQKKTASAAKRQSIYDRFASSKDSASVDGNASGGAQDISVSEALKDSSGQQTTSIYDRYGAVKENEGAAENNAPAEGSAPAENSAPAEGSAPAENNAPAEAE